MVSARFRAKYYGYQATQSVGFVSPIFTLFLLRTLSFTEVGTLGALYSALVVLGEVPTGYVADRLGRRASLALSVVFTVCSLAGFVVSQTFPAYVLFYAFWALARTFVSGSVDAWLYELLDARAEPGEFTRVRGRGIAVMRVTSVATMLGGGVLYAVDPTYPFLASVALNALGLVALYTLPGNRGYGVEPGDGSGDDVGSEGDADAFDRITLLDALPLVREQFTRPPLRSVVLYAGLFFAVVGAADTYVQPVARTLFERTLTDGVLTNQVFVGGALAAIGLGGRALPESALVGVLYAGFTAVAAVGSYYAGDVEARLGFGRALVAISLATALLLVLPRRALALALPMFVAMRGSTTLLSPMVNGFLNDHIDAVGRATTLSAFSMLTQLLRVPLALLAGVVGDAFGETASVAVLGAVFLVGAGVAGALAVVGSERGIRERGQSAAGDDPE